MEEGLMAKLIDGKAIREQELDRLGRRVSELKSEGISPSLAFINLSQVVRMLGTPLPSAPRYRIASLCVWPLSTQAIVPAPL